MNTARLPSLTITAGRILRKDLDFVVTMSIIGSVVGAIYRVVLDGRFTLPAVLDGAGIGLTIALASVSTDLIIFSRLTRLSFATQLTVKMTTYTSLCGVIILLRYVVMGTTASLLTQPVRLLAPMLITLAVSGLASLLLGIRRILGRHALHWLLISRYSRPVEEIRVFMFMDHGSSIINSAGRADRPYPLSSAHSPVLVRHCRCDSFCTW